MMVCCYFPIKNRLVDNILMLVVFYCCIFHEKIYASCDGSEGCFDYLSKTV